MSSKIGWHMNGDVHGSTDGNVSEHKSYNGDDLYKYNNVNKADNINYNLRANVFLYLCIGVNMILFAISSLCVNFIFNKQGIILYYSCDASMIVFIFSFIALGLMSSQLSRKRKKGTLLPPRITLNINSYKKAKIIIFISEFIVMIALCISVRFFSNITSYNNGFLTFNNNSKITQVNVSDIKYITIFCKKQHHSSKHSNYDYLGISADCRLNNNTIKNLAVCDSKKKLSALTSFLDDLKATHNFQDVSVSNNDVTGDINTGVKFKYLSDGKPPILYFRTFSSQLSGVKNTEVTVASEKYVNERSNAKKYSDYIMGK